MNISKMPIVYIDIHAENKTIRDLYDLVDYFDFVFELDDKEVREYTNDLSSKINMPNSFVIQNNLETYSDILARISNLRSGNVLIVANKNYFDLILPGFMKDDWNTTGFQN